MEILVLALAFVIILAGAELFTNSIEWFGHKLGLAEGAVGSVLAAVGTALPETMIPIIAIVFATGEASEEIGVGAILGAPFMLSTLAMFVTGVAVLVVARRRTTGDTMQVDSRLLTHDALRGGSGRGCFRPRSPPVSSHGCARPPPRRGGTTAVITGIVGIGG